MRKKLLGLIIPIISSVVFSFGAFASSAVSANSVPVPEKTGVIEAVLGKTDQKKNDSSNILLIGQDTRDPGQRARSDTMILCNINKRTGKIKLVSFMRDLYVSIPGYEDNRINAAYAYGGAELLDKTIEENFGVHIDGNVEVDFDRFISSLSQIGNLDIELNKEEAEFLNSHAAWIKDAVSNADPSEWDLSEGVNSMTAEQVLSYARIRFVGNNDYERTERQRKVLISAFDKISNEDLLSIIRLAKKIIPDLRTDLSVKDILGYVYTAVSRDMNIDSTSRIPADGYSHGESVRGMSVIVPDLKANREILNDFLTD